MSGSHIGVSSDDIVNLARNLSSNSLVRSMTALTAAAAVGTATYYYATRPKPSAFGIDIENQSIIIDEQEGIRASSLCAPDGMLRQFVYEDATTLYEGFQRGLRVSGNGPCLGKRKDNSSPYEWTSYQEVANLAQALGSAFINNMNQGAVNSTMIGIFSSNRHEWVICEQACNMYSMISVPLYDTLGTDACKYILDQTELQVVLVDTLPRLRLLLDLLDNKCFLKHIVVCSSVTEEDKAKAETIGVTLHSFEDAVKAGKAALVEPVPPNPSDLAVICYTSGTTGNPKGVLLTHGAIVSMVFGLTSTMYANSFEGSKDTVRLTHNDVHISYLPLAHMFERSAQVAVFMEGGRVGFFRGNIRELMDDIKELKPTLFCAVPRLLSRIFDKIMSAVSGSRVKTRLLEWAVEKKMHELQRGIVRNDTIWDRMLFRKVHQSLGGQVKLILTGSAPVSERVLRVIRAAVGCFVVEGYGQTECTAGVTGTPIGEYRGEVVGPPLPCNYVKLIDVPEMGYFAGENGGEVCVKGFNVFSGYFKMPEKTAETIDKDGWVHTGDIGKWTEFGSLKIVDRCKHIFKLSQGEYIAPEKVENAYIQARHVAQCFVDGNSLRSCIVAIVVPDFEALIPDLEKLGLQRLGSAPEALCKSEEVKKMIQDEMSEVAKKAGLKGFEQVKNIFLNSQLFSVENGLLTPTLKAKRNDLRHHFAREIQDMYTALGDV